MCKKIALFAMALVILASAGVVFAQEERAGAKGRQMRRGQAGRFEQDRPADRPGPKGGKPMAQRQGQLAAGLDKWLGELTKAHREEDHEKIGQLLRKMNQARRKVRQRQQQSGPGEKGFRQGQGAGQGRMRGGRVDKAGPKYEIGRSGRGMGRRQAGGMNRPGRGMGRGGRRVGRGQGRFMNRPGHGIGRGGEEFRQHARRMFRSREHAGRRFQGMGRPGRQDGPQGFMSERGPRW